MDRLRQRADFLAVANGARVSSAAFSLLSRARSDRGPIRVGFTVTRKNGTATERNRIRRRLRELVKRLDVISMRPHHDYVLVGRREALTRDFAVMLDDLHSALRRLDRKAFSSEVGSGSRQESASNKRLPAKAPSKEGASKRDSRRPTRPE